MSAANAFETALLALVFQAQTWDGIAQNDTTTPDTDIYYGLHTGDPGEAGNQTTSETNYTSYSREAVARTTGGHDVTGNVCSPVAQIDFPEGTGGSGTVSHFSTGRAASSTGTLHVTGTCTPNVTVGAGVTPSLTTDTEITCE